MGNILSSAPALNSIAHDENVWSIGELLSELLADHPAMQAPASLAPAPVDECWLDAVYPTLAVGAGA